MDWSPGTCCASMNRRRACATVARAERVTFHNPLQNRPFTQTVYLARKQAVLVTERSE